VSVLLVIVPAAVAAWLIVCCVRLWRQEQAYMERRDARSERFAEDVWWLLERVEAAERAERFSVERAS
jgi:hypothetical protein